MMFTIKIFYYLVTKKNIENFKHKKIAFCFLIKDKINNEDIWEYFFKNIPKNKYNIYIHHKNNIKLKYFDKYKLNNNIETKWCDKSLVYAQNLLLEEALKDADNQHFIFLSGNCVPIKNFNKIYNNLDQNYSYFKEPKKINNNQLYKTSQWCILNRKHTKLILDNSNSWIEKNKPKTKNMCHDEYVYINVLLNLNLKNEIIYKKSTWTSWNNKIDIDLKDSILIKKQPFYFKTINTFTLKQIIDSESFFARKFQDSCNLDLIRNIF